ncbi:MAG: YeeE/YedE family protein [Reyranella sp.]|nr:YeeE/YedE family protein [Reyranella sp.]
MDAGTNLTALVVWSGFGLAVLFGAVAAKTNFCTMGAVSDVVNMGNWGRMRMWLLAMAIAIIGANALHAAGLVDLSKSIYQRPTLTWLSSIVGGLCFGVGMTLGSGCVNKTLIRVGGGSLRSLVVLLVVAITAYATIKGLFGQWRASWLDPVAINFGAHGMRGQDLPSLLAGLAGVAPRTAVVATAAVLAGGLLLFVFKDARFRRNRNQILGGVTIGLLVTAGWYVSGHLGFGENPETLEMVYFATNTRAAESFSFVAPAAYGLELFMLWTDKSLGMTFGIASALGIVAGSFAYAIATRTFSLEGFASAGDTRNHLLGGVLMGFGGVTALGCTIGQGVTGLSTLALGSLITLLAIIAGAAATMKYLYWREERESNRLEINQAGPAA